MKGFATVVWFHGGGLTSGGRYIPAALKGKKIAVVAVDYRLYPRVKAPAYIEDAAAAVAWTFKNIERYGGDPDRIFVSGHTITHFTVRKERGIDGKQPIIDDLAPLYHVRADAPPLLLITG